MGQEIEPAKLRAFASAYVSNGGNGQQAAVSAGWAASAASSVASRLLRRDDVRSMLAREAARLAGDLTPALLMVLAGLAQDTGLRPADRIAAANSVLDRGPLRRGQTSEVTHSVADPAGLIAEIWRKREERLKLAGPQVIDVAPDDDDAS
jgi:hypothetical protein